MDNARTDNRAGSRNNESQLSLAAVFKFVMAAGLFVAFSVAIQSCSSPVHTKPQKNLAYHVFYLGMTADEALAKLPAGYSLEPLAILHEHPKGATAADQQNDEYFTIANDERDWIPLFFNQSKQLVTVAPEFDEEKYVALYQQRRGREQQPSAVERRK
jgi:hypothetical protein